MTNESMYVARARLIAALEINVGSGQGCNYFVLADNVKVAVENDVGPGYGIVWQ